MDVDVVSSAVRAGSPIVSEMGVDGSDGVEAGDAVRDATDTPKISARAAGDCDASRFETKCFWRELKC